MKNALILHGIGNNHTGNWFPWLEKELTARGYTVWTPDLPNPDIPNVSIVNQFIFTSWQLDRDSIIVGHSSGAVLALGLLQALPKETTISAAYLVAGFTQAIDGFAGHKELFLTPFEYSKIKTKASEIVLFHSDDDPYVALSHGEKLKEYLNAQLIVLKGQKHFSIGTGGPHFKEFPELLSKIGNRV